MSSGKPGDGSIAKAAGVAVATGIAWSLYKSFVPKKEALIQENFDSSAREEFVVSEPESPAKEEVFEVETVETKTQEVEVVAIESKAQEPDPDEAPKPWFFFGDFNKKPIKSKPKLSEPAESKSTAKMSETYEIKNGDTLYGISRKYEVSIEVLKAANGCSGDLIYAGDKLVIPK